MEEKIKAALVKKVHEMVLEAREHSREVAEAHPDRLKVRVRGRIEVTSCGGSISILIKSRYRIGWCRVEVWRGCWTESD